MNAAQNADVTFQNAKFYIETFFQELEKLDQSSNHSVENLDALLSLYKKNLPGRFCLYGMLAVKSNQLDDRSKDLLSKFFVRTEKWLREVITNLPGNSRITSGLPVLLLSSLEGALLMDGVKGKEKYLNEVQKFIRSLG